MIVFSGGLFKKNSLYVVVLSGFFYACQFSEERLNHNFLNAEHVEGKANHQDVPDIAISSSHDVATSRKIISALNNENNQGFINPLPVVYQKPMSEQEIQHPTWAFTPKKDTFSDKALLDLSFLNEEVAGQHGWITTSEDGNDFSRGDGQPMRFWATGTTVFRLGMAELKDHAKFLAKRGINLVRWHGQIVPKGPKDDFHSIDKKALDELFQMVAAMKEQGIYVAISPYYAELVRRRGWGKAIGKNWPVPRTEGVNNTAQLLFFDKELQSAYKSWIKQLLMTKNPYTGLALKDDPAVALFQIQNEDSLLFWSINRLYGEDLDTLRKAYGDWLLAKYGSFKAVQAAWRNAPPEGSPIVDHWKVGKVSFANIWHLTQDRVPQKFQPRFRDQTEFLSETMRNFNADIVDFIRTEIKTPVLINANNWKTASVEKLNDLERYTYAVGDVMGVNRYVTGLHEGDRNGFAIARGQYYDSLSVLEAPEQMPTSIKQVKGYPFIVSESLWVPPNSYQSEGPFLVSAMQSLTGVDAFFWFNAEIPQWQGPARIRQGADFMRKWLMLTPMQLGQFPAAALSYRLGLIQKGKTLLDEKRRVEDLYTRENPIIHENDGYDPNRDQDSDKSRLSSTLFFGKEKGRAEVGQKINPLAFLSGAVMTSFVDGDAFHHDTELSQITSDSGDRPSIDQQSKEASSIEQASRDELRKELAVSQANQRLVASNHQIIWDFKHKQATINAPASQGVCGFFKEDTAHQSVTSQDVHFSINNHYACVWLVALDQKPINESGSILVQMGTRQFPTNWKSTFSVWKNKHKQTVPARRLLDYGHEPWQIEKLEATIKLNNSSVKRMLILDENGQAVDQKDLAKGDDGWVMAELPNSALYAILQ